MITVGTGPCATCHQALDDIPLTGETQQADDGGTWWRVEAGITCGNCGQRLDWMHEGPIVLELATDRRAAVSALLERTGM